MSPLLVVEDLAVYYGRAQILFGVDLAVEEGEAIAVVGRNGAGKTTTLKALAGFVPRATGSVLMDSVEVPGDPLGCARLGIAYVPEERRLFSGLTVGENLLLAYRPGGPWTCDDILDRVPLLAERWSMPAGVLSGGEQQLAAIARGLVMNPRLLLLDEPSQGIAPMLLQTVRMMVQEHVARGGSTILVEQSVAFVQSVVADAYVLDRGSVVCRARAEALDSDPELASILAL